MVTINHLGEKFSPYIMGGISVLSAFCMLLYSDIILHPILVCGMLLGISSISWYVHKYESQDTIVNHWLIYFVSLLFSIFKILGMRIVSSGQFSATIDQAYLLPIGKTEIAMMVLLSILTYQLVCFLFLLFARYSLNIRRNLANFGKALLSAKHLQSGTFVVLLMSWGTFFLAFFPGTGMNDTLWIWNSPLNASIQHTLTYNYIMYGLMSLGNLIGGSWLWGVALYSVVQLIFCAWTVSYVLKWLSTRNIPCFLWIVLFLFFTFSRTIANVSVQAVKDTLFSFSLLLLIPLLFECSETQGCNLLKPNNLFLFLFSSAMIILVRNNGFLVMAGTMVFIVFSCRKNWKTTLAICMVALLLPYGINSYLMKTLVKQDKIAVESLGIPLQQMAAVVARGGEMNKDEIQIMDTIMPLEEIKSRYRPTTTDTLKWGTGAQYLNKAWIADNQGAFLKTWGSMLWKNLDIYVEAYLLETLSYWKIGEPSKAQGLYYSFPQSSSVDLIVNQQRVLPQAIHDALQKYYRMDQNTELPSGGTMIWSLIFFMTYLLCTKQSKKTLCFVPAILVWITVMLSAPIAYGFRYVLSLYLAFPFLLSTLFVNVRNKSEAIS